MKINSLYCIRSVLTLVFRINGQGLISVQGGRISIQGIPAFRDFTIRPLFRDSVLGLNFLNFLLHVKKRKYLMDFVY